MSAASPAPSCAAPCLEPLEPRLLLSTLLEVPGLGPLGDPDAGGVGTAYVHGIPAEYYSEDMLPENFPAGGGPAGGYAATNPPNGRVLIVVENELLANMGGMVDFYVAQLEADGFTTEVQGLSASAPYAGIRQALVSYHVLHPDLSGVVFVGCFEDPPMFELDWYDDEDKAWKYETWPCDFYFMDLDGTWNDLDGNGLLDDHAESNALPEIWVSRINPGRVGNEAALLEQYLQKLCDYRTGALAFEERGLMYIDDDWRDAHGEWTGDMEELYPGAVTSVYNKNSTTRCDLIGRFSGQSYEFLHNAAHASWESYSYRAGDDPGGEVKSSELGREGLNFEVGFHNWFHCSFARYTEADYGAGMYIFDSDFGMAGVGSTKVGSMLESEVFYDALGQGATMGEALLQWLRYIGDDYGGYDPSEVFWFYGMCCIGDGAVGPQRMPVGVPTPDLQSWNESYNGFDPETVHPLYDWMCQWSVKNFGDGDAGPFDVDVYLSVDPYVNPGVDTYLGTIAFPALASGQGTIRQLELDHFPDIDYGYYFIGVAIDPDDAVHESVENNNLAVYAATLLKVLPVPLPDLIGDWDEYSTFTPEEVFYDQPWECQWRVHNAGADTAEDDFAVFFYASVDQDIDPATDELLGYTIVTENIASGRGGTTTLSIAAFPDTIPEGDYYVGVVIDYFDNVNESDEDNNVDVDLDGYPLHVGGPPLPDFADGGDAYSQFSPTHVHVGDAWHFETRIANVGLADWTPGSGEYLLASIYLSEDEDIDPVADSWIAGNILDDAIPAGGHVTYAYDTEDWSFPGPGRYYVGVVVDRYNYIVESDETNNAWADLSTGVLVVGDLPDLAPLGDPLSSFTPRTLWAGDAWEVTWGIRNYGVVDAGTFPVAFFLSEDADIDVRDDDYLGGTWVTGGLAAETSTTVGRTLDHFPDVPPGDYYVGIIVDSNRSVVETDEENNFGHDYDCYPLRVMGPTPDLYLAPGSAADYGPQSVIPGQTWQGTWTVYNGGDARAEAFYVDYYASIDATVDPAEDYLIGSTWVEFVYPGLTAPANVSLADFPAVPPGTYYVGAIVDRDDQVVERDETNNAGVADLYPLTVTWSGSGSVSGTKFDDADNDGRRDPGEAGVPGWTVYLDQNRNGQLDPNEPTRTTDGGGNYCFASLPPGVFYAAEVTQAGWIQTHPHAGLPDDRLYVAATMADDTVRILDADLEPVGSFPAGSPNPSAIAADTSLIYTAHADSGEVIAYNHAGVEQFRWTSTQLGNATGMALVGDELAVHRSVLGTGAWINFFDPSTGVRLRQIDAAVGYGIAGLAYDGEDLWQLGLSGIYRTDPSDGTVLETLSVPAACAGMTVSGIGELTLAATNGDWYRLLTHDGHVVGSGDNALDMYGLKVLPGGQPEFLVDFEDIPAPPVFADTRALRDHYAHLGVRFDAWHSSVPLNAGAVLNEDGAFGVSGYSGRNFLALSNSGSATLTDGGQPAPPQRITFDHPVSYLEFKVGSEYVGQTLTVDVYDTPGWLLDAFTIDLSAALQTVSLRSSVGIARVELSSDATTLVIDDLGFSGAGPPGEHGLSLVAGEDVTGNGFGNYEGGLPDLVDDIDALSWFSPTTVAPGDYWELYWQFRNDGTGDAGPFKVTFYASEDTDIDPAEDHYLYEEDVYGVGAGGVTGVEVYMDSFPAIHWGAYYVGVLIDRYDQVLEADETNNTGVDHTSYPLAVTGPGQPDLMSLDGGTRSASPNPATVGAAWTGQWEVFNDGDVAAGAFDVAFHLSEESHEFDPLFAPLVGTARVGGLAADTSTVVTLDLTSFPSITPGDYWLAIDIDADDEVAELHESNNEDIDLGLYPVTVMFAPAEPDLTGGADGTTGFTPQTVEAGEWWEAWWGIENYGPGDAGAFDVEFYASADDAIDAFDYWLGSTRIGGLVGYGSTSAGLTLGAFPAYVPAGDYFLGVVIDAGEEVDESSESNNTAVDYNPYPLTVLEPEYDFGDAPDPTYPTLLGSGGARHRLGSPVRLGASVDADDDGQPNAGATGDDVDGTDDEDGVTFLTPLAPGVTGEVRVHLAAAGVLNAWFDFNHDGDWDDADEHAIVDHSGPAGTEGISFTVPAGAAIGETFARFRVSTVGGLGPGGAADDGEVEDYAVSIVQMDFGDAPDPWFPTLAASEGARHVLGAGLYLGGGVDADLDGQPNADATGDDADGSDDEDGVIFLSALVPGESADVRVTASGAGFLQVWLDVYADGSWADPVDQIVTDEPLAAGGNTVTFDVPDGAVQATTFARFRFSSSSGLTDMGSAEDGEVEDYEVTIGAPASISGVKFYDANANRAKDLGEARLSGWTVFLDNDGDGVLDDGETFTVTDEFGQYAFTDLMPGDYEVAEVGRPDYVQRHPAGSHVLTVGPGEDRPDVDFGNILKGDATGDGEVDVLDLARLANNFGKTDAEWPDADFNGDGVVDVLDLATIANSFGNGVGGSAPPATGGTAAGTTPAGTRSVDVMQPAAPAAGHAPLDEPVVAAEAPRSNATARPTQAPATTDRSGDVLPAAAAWQATLDRAPAHPRAGSVRSGTAATGTERRDSTAPELPQPSAAAQDAAGMDAATPAGVTALPATGHPIEGELPEWDGRVDALAAPALSVLSTALP